MLVGSARSCVYLLTKLPLFSDKRILLPRYSYCRFAVAFVSVFVVSV